MKATRSPFLAPFRVDRATAMSDIVVRIVADGLRHSTAAAAHKMPVYAWSAFLAVNAFRAILRRKCTFFYMPSQPKIRPAWYFADRDVAQVCRDSDDLTVPTVSEVHTLADAHEAARGRRPYCPNDFVGSPGSQGLVPTQLRLKRHTIAHPVVYLSATSGWSG